MRVVPTFLEHRISRAVGIGTVVALATAAAAGGRAGALPAPTLLSVTGAPGYNVHLAWSASPGAAGYRIVRNGAVIGSAVQTSYLDATVNGPRVFVYAVRAYGAGGAGPLSNRKGIFVPSDIAPIVAIKERRSIIATPVGFVPIRLTCSAFVYACAGQLTLSFGSRQLGRARFSMGGGQRPLVKVLLTDDGFTLLMRRQRLHALAVASTKNGIQGRTARSQRFVLRAPRSGIP